MYLLYLKMTNFYRLCLSYFYLKVKYFANHSLQMHVLHVCGAIGSDLGYLALDYPAMNYSDYFVTELNKHQRKLFIALTPYVYLICPPLLGPV